MVKCTSHKSTLYHDPDCAMSFFAVLLPTAHFLQNCRRTQPCTLVFVQKCGRPLPNRGQRTHTREVGSPVAHTSSRGPGVEQHVCVGFVLVRCGTRLRLATTPSWLTAALPISRPLTPQCCDLVVHRQALLSELVRARREAANECVLRF